MHITHIQLSGNYVSRDDYDNTKKITYIRLNINEYMTRNTYILKQNLDVCEKLGFCQNLDAVCEIKLYMFNILASKSNKMKFQYT